MAFKACSARPPASAYVSSVLLAFVYRCLRTKVINAPITGSAHITTNASFQPFVKATAKLAINWNIVVIKVGTLSVIASRILLQSKEIFVESSLALIESNQAMSCLSTAWK